MARILLVEDNELNVDMLKRRLERKANEVLVASDGATGVKMAREQHPQLILMDISLPVMDGYEAIRQLKANEATRNIPIIALTAHALSSDRQKCLDAGADDYDTKPIEFTRLLSKVNRLLGGEEK